MIDIHNAKERTEQAGRAKSILLRIWSHEIRTPINAIIGMAAIAKRSQELEMNRSLPRLLPTVLNNTVEFTTEEKRITLEVQRLDDESDHCTLEVRINDTRIEIPQEQ